MKPVKKVSLLVIASACVLTVCVTLALMSKITETATNTFTSDRSISIALREDKWDGFTFEDTYEKEPGSVAKDGLTEDQINELGITKATNYYPGDVIPKNPTLKNTSKEDEYVAIKVTYVNNDGEAISKDLFETTYGEINNLSSDFKRIEISGEDGYKYDLYIYRKLLKADSEQLSLTPALFDKVVVNQDIKTVNGIWPTFKLKVQGYAVQAKNVTLDVEDPNNEVVKALKDLAKSN